MDGINQIGKHLNKVNDTANRALQRQAADSGVGESVRDIFDSVVPYQMHFRAPKSKGSVKASLKFELPPPNIGMGSCCSDCFCSKCEKFAFDDFTNRVVLTEYPYMPGTVRVFDSYGQVSLVTETDPAAGIVNLGYDPESIDGNVIHVCYVYKYDANCTTVVVPDLASLYCFYDTFTRSEAISWNVLNTQYDNTVTLGTSDSGHTWPSGTNVGYVEASENSSASITLDGTMLKYASVCDYLATYPCSAVLTTRSLPSRAYSLIEMQFMFEVLEPLVADGSSFTLFYQAQKIEPLFTDSIAIKSSIGVSAFTSSLSLTIYFYGTLTQFETVSTSFPLSVYIMYNLKYEFDYDNRVHRFKLWEDGAEEPDYWTLTQLITSEYPFPGVLDATDPQLRFEINTQPGNFMSVDIDNLNMTCG